MISIFYFFRVLFGLFIDLSRKKCFPMVFEWLVEA